MTPHLLSTPIMPHAQVQWVLTLRMTPVKGTTTQGHRTGAVSNIAGG